MKIKILFSWRTFARACRHQNVFSKQAPERVQKHTIAKMFDTLKKVNV